MRLYRRAELTYLGGEPGCSSSCEHCAARRIWDQMGGLELPRTSQDAGKAPFLLRNRSLCYLCGSHLHTHPNYLLAPQNAVAPGTQAALPRTALACNVLRAGGCEARRQVLPAAGLLDLSARHGQQEQLHTAPSAKSREQALLYHCAGYVSGQMCVFGTISTQAIDIYSLPPFSRYNVIKRLQIRCCSQKSSKKAKTKDRLRAFILDPVGPGRCRVVHNDRNT